MAGRHPVLAAAGDRLARICGHVVACWRQEADQRASWSPVLLGCGIGTYFALPGEPALWCVALGPAGIGLWVWLRDRAGATVLLVGAVVLFLSGFSLAIARTRVAPPSTLAAPTGIVTVTGRIGDLEPVSRGRVRLWLDVHTVDPVPGALPDRVRLLVPRPAFALGPGDWVEVRASLQPLPAPVAPGLFDFGRKLWFDGVGATGFALSGVVRIRALRPDSWIERIHREVLSLRHAVSARILAVTPAREGPIAAAFLTGERGLIGEADNVAMRDSSLAHLLSISGLHMMLAGFGFFTAFRLALTLLPGVALGQQVRKIAAGGALVVSFLYLLLSGASVPTQRSFIMVFVALVAILADRTVLGMRTLAVAAFIVLAVAPEAWIDPSFQMSFAAVAALMSAYEWWTRTQVPAGGARSLLARVLALFTGTAATSFIAGLATAPFAAFHFNRFANYGAAANVLVMPLVSFIIMPAGVIALLVMPFGLEAVPLAVMAWGIGQMLSAAHWVAGWPGAVLAVPAMPAWCLLLMVAGLLWLILWRAAWRWMGAGVMIVGLSLGLAVQQPDVIIAADGRNAAVRGDDGRFHFLSARRRRFDAEMWLRADGDTREVREAMQLRRGGFLCNGMGCTMAVRGRRQAAFVLALSDEAVIRACRTALVLVNMNEDGLPGCRQSPLVVTQAMLDREGAIAVFVERGAVAWTSVRRERGDRPWSR